MKRFISKFIEMMSDIKIDKLWHFIMGYLIYSISFFLLYQFTKIGILGNTLWPLATVIVAGLVREIGWRNSDLEESISDFIYTVLGAIPMFVICNYVMV